MAKLVVAAGQDDGSLARANRRLEGYIADTAVARSLAQGRAAATRARGAPALVAASSTLRRDVMPELERAQDTLTAKVGARLDSAEDASATAALVGAITLVGFVVVQVWLARRSRRVLNPPLAIGSLGLLAAAAATAALLADSSAIVDRAQQGPGRSVSALVEARIAAFDARAVETLGLLTSDLAGTEERWRTSIGRADAALERARRTSDGEAAKAAAHLDGTGGCTPTSCGPPTRPGPSGWRPTPPTMVPRQLRQPGHHHVGAARPQVDLLDRDLSRSAALMPVAAWLCLGAGVAAAVAGGLGVGRRLAEYR
jgi:hypothetical protein